MNYMRIIEQIVLSACLGLGGVATNYLSKINEKLDHLTMSVQEVAYKNEGRFQVIDVQIANLERVCSLKKRL